MHGRTLPGEPGADYFQMGAWPCPAHSMAQVYGRTLPAALLLAGQGCKVVSYPSQLPGACVACAPVASGQQQLGLG